MENEQIIYFVSGLPGMGKTSKILPGMDAKKENLIALSTDNVRKAIVHAPNVCTLEFHINKFLDGILKTDSEIIDGFDGLAALGFIKYHSLFSKQKSLLIDTIAFTPKQVRDLELDEPKLKIKAAFIGYSKKAKDTRPEKLQLHYNDYDEIERSDKIKKAAEELNLPNYRYFDLIECVPAERRDQDVVPLEQADFDKNADKVIEYLLRD